LTAKTDFVIFPKVQSITDLCPPPFLYAVCSSRVPWGKLAGGVKLTTHVYLVMRLGMKLNAHIYFSHAFRRQRCPIYVPE